MTRRARIGLFLAAAPVFAATLFWGLTGLPDFGAYHHAYGNVLNAIVVPKRHTTNVVGAVVFDVRGFDTMGEEFILFASVMGVTLLLRETREGSERDWPRDEATNDGVRLVGLLMVPVTVLLGLWLVSFGYVTPGGGFQGGVALAGGLILLWAAGSYRSYRHASPPPLVDLVEGVGAGGYVVIGLAAVLSGLAFLENLLGPGKTGTLWSGGSIAFLNWSSALEVAAANVLLFHEFLKEYVPMLREQV